MSDTSWICLMWGVCCVLGAIASLVVLPRGQAITSAVVCLILAALFAVVARRHIRREG